MIAPPGLSLLIKPAGAECNLDCDYCFYLRTAGSDVRAGPPRMSDAVLERMLAGYLELSLPVHSFCWQGGEPLLMGPGFYRRVTELQQRLARPGTVIANSVQTNATLVDDALAEHFARYRFLVGCSIDGPAPLHDRHRRTRAGGASHEKVLAGRERLRRHGVEVNSLKLVSDANVGHPVKVYDYLVEQGFRFLQFIPCVEFDSAGRRQPYAISGRQWGDFLCAVYDRWFEDGPGRISIRLFDSLMARLAYGAELLCTFAADCRQYLVVEHDGAVYPCDFQVRPDRRLGNVLDDPLADLLGSPRYAGFGVEKSALPEPCTVCRHRELCRGDCPLHRGSGGIAESDGSWLCTGWRAFFDHAGPGLEELARAEAAGQRVRAEKDRR